MTVSFISRISKIHQVADTGVMATKTEACWAGNGNKDNHGQLCSPETIGHQLTNDLMHPSVTIRLSEKVYATPPNNPQPLW